MKRILFLAVILLFKGTAFSQAPILTQANNGWIAGDSYINYYLDTTAVVPGVSGSNVTWNFTSLVVNTAVQSSQSFVTAASTPFASSFSSATVASVSGDSYQYFSINATSCNMHGMAATGLIMAYSDPAKFFSYPFTYNTTLTDNFSCNYTYSGYTFNRTGTVTSVGDAWGKLMLPGKTYNNILRVKMTQNTTDVNIAYTTYSLTTTYWWLDGITKAPIFEITTGASSNTYQTGTTYSKRVVINAVAVVGIDDVTNNGLKISVSPNPAKEYFTIESSIHQGKWELMDIAGKLVRSGEINEVRQQLDCRNINNGIYLIRISNDEGKSVVQKVIIDN